MKSRADIRDHILIGLSLVFLFAYAVPIIWPTLDAVIINSCNAVQWLVWLVFGIDFVWRFFEANSKKTFLRSNWLDLLILVVPTLRALRLLRALSMASLASRRVGRGAAFRAGLGIRTGTTTALVAIIAALAVTEAERGEGTIGSFGDGLWWAITTMTTVGYGDHYPVTMLGRVIGASLMFFGIALLSIVSASVASWIIEKLDRTDETIAAEANEIAELRREIAGLRELLERDR